MKLFKKALLLSVISLSILASAPVYSASLPDVVTLNADSITKDSAVLRGYVSPNGSGAVVKFEYGTEPLLSSTSSTKVLSSSQNFSIRISGLRSDTTYYYRSVAYNSQGSDVGVRKTFKTNSDGSGVPAPTFSVSTDNATNITRTSASLNGNINGSPLTTYVWFEWGSNYSNLNYTTNQNTKNGTGSFNQSVTNLSSGETYYFRAVARDSHGTIKKGSVKSFETITNVIPSTFSVETRSATSITTNLAVLNGRVNADNDSLVLFEWGTSVSLGYSTARSYKNGNSNFNYNLFNLNPNSTYYFRAVATKDGVTKRGNIVSFKTENGYVPPVETLSAETRSATSITTNSAKLNGYVNTSSNATVSFEYGQTSSLGQMTYSQNVVSDSLVNVSLFGLQSNTTYYFRTKAINGNDVSSGSILSFKTENGYVPPVETLSAETRSATSITTNSATLNGYVDVSGSSNTVVSFEYGQTSSLGQMTYSQNVSSDSSFSISLFGLNANSNYYFRANATQNGVTERGSILSFTTNNNSNNSDVSVSTNSATNITETSATLNGYLNSQTSGNITRWFDYGTSPSFGQETNRIQLSGGSSSFNAYISGLNRNVTYYFRAVAQSSNGGNISFGNTMTFVTNYGGNNNGSNRPLVYTNYATNIYKTAVVLNGWVDPRGSTSTTRWFEWGPTYSLGYTSPVVNHIGSSSDDYEASVHSLEEDRTYYFRSIAKNEHGISYGSIISFTTNYGGGNYVPDNKKPFVTTKNAVDVGRSSAIINARFDSNNAGSFTRWFEYGTSLMMSNKTQEFTQTYSADASANLSGLKSNTTYYFRGVARNYNGHSYGNTFKLTTSGNGVIVTGPIVVTNTATSLTTTSSLLNGTILPVESIYTSGWFEWGRTPSLGNRTPVKSLNYSLAIDFADNLTGLSSNTIYYYRAVGQTNGGAVNGNVVSFKTRSGGVIKKPVSPVVINLIITADRSRVKGGDLVNFVVEYENLSDRTIKDTLLRVVLPYGLSFGEGCFENGSGNVLEFKIGKLAPAERKATRFQTYVNEDVLNNSILNTTAVLSYTDTKTGKDGFVDNNYAMVVEDESIEDDNNLAAVTFLSGIFLPNSLLGWLLLIILLLVLVILARKVYGYYEEMQVKDKGDIK